MTPYPIRFRPLLKQTIWGGRRLGDQLGKTLGPESNYAESWEVVDHGADQSVVENGPLAGSTLADLIREHAGWLLGDAPNNQTAFPLLLKYLDCNRVLSVQVHPDDRYGLAMPEPDLGKTEAWFIVDAEPDALIYAGLKEGVDREQLAAAIQQGTTEETLHSFHPQPGDCVFIPAGTVHALGAGLLVAEIQQSSNTTFRLFDWNRVDSEGNSRPLHIEQAIEVTDYESGPVPPRRTDPAKGNWQTIVECDKFVFRALRRGAAELNGDQKFHILTVPRGQADLEVGGETMSLETGESVLIPAAFKSANIAVTSDVGTVLEMHLP